MRQNLLGVFLVFILVKAFADDTRLAQDYFEAGNYARAKIEYEGLLDDRQEEWKNDILVYNIATSLLAEGCLEEALLLLEKAAEKEIRQPFLKKNIFFNLILARLEQVKNLMSRLKDSPNLSYEDYRKVHVFFVRAEEEMQEAESAWCQLEIAEGAVECPPSKRILEFKLEFKTLLEDFLREWQAYQLGHASLQEGVFYLLFKEKTLLLSSNPLSSLNLETAAQDRLNGMWKKVGEILTGKVKNKDGNNQISLFNQAKQQFLESRIFVEKGDFAAGKKSLEKSLQLLHDLLFLIFKEGPVADVIHGILNIYTIALMEEPIQEVYLAQLYEIQKDLSEILKPSIDAGVFKKITESLSFLKLSAQALDQSQYVQARFFAEIARFYIKEIVESFNPANGLAYFLEAAIAKEEFILFLNHLKGQVLNLETAVQNNPFKEADPLFLVLQQAALKDADQFLKTLLAKQKEVFGMENKSKNRCQCTPWNEMIPLFSEGYVSGQLASRRLEKGDNGSSTGFLQKSAISRWNEALAKMKNPSSDQRQLFHETEKEQFSSKKNVESAKTQAVQKLVQEMEEDDKSRPQIQRTSSGIERQQRPW